VRALVITLAAVVGVVCALVLAALLALVAGMEVESRLQQRRRRLALRRDIRLFEKGYR
jgi:hypothetical protein